MRRIGLDHDVGDYMTFRPTHGCDFDVESQEDSSPFDYIWEIYSLRSNSLEKLDVDMDDHSIMENWGHLYMDGLSHWMCRRESRDTDNQTYMESFDWSSEVFRTTTPKHCVEFFNKDTEDYFKKLRAYFKMIDEFELPVEEVESLSDS
ncbi:F-box protein [Trifolium pratense]|uniref:F-box protein n=1 Tax=Trifolium pratense TaxID=57577 RepID=A0A2K3LQK1_TRIPR|nr:F-box protein [Trifolium pratense]